MVDLVIDESKVWSEEERQAYADALPEMSLFEDHIIEGDPMVEAMNALIEEGETNETLALHWKLKGNEMFSDAKKYNKMYFNNALKYYSDSILYAERAIQCPSDMKSDIDNLDYFISTVLSNRAAVHFELKNYGSCRSDCARAIKYNPKNVKAYFRGAKASAMLHRPVDVLNYTTQGLVYDVDNEPMKKLKEEGLKLLEMEQRKKEKKEFERRSRRLMTEKYKKLCASRNIQVGPAIFDDERVRTYEGKADLDKEDRNQMYWPVLFLYDEYVQSDFVEAMGENDRFLDHLANMFPEGGPYCPWDLEHEYEASKLAIYVPLQVVVPFETDEEWHVQLSGEKPSDALIAKRERNDELLEAKTQVWIKPHLFSTLLQVLQHPHYVVPGIPIIKVVVKGSQHEEKFLASINAKIIEV